MGDELEQTIRQKAQTPAKASGDSGSVEQHPLKDQIEADRYLASKKAAKARGRGVGLTKLVPPAANQSGSATITVTVSDGSATANDTFLLTVNAVNDTPTNSSPTLTSGASASPTVIVAG